MTGGRQIVKAMAVITRPRDGALLVSEHADPAGASFHRPLGGHVEFGERAEDTIRREFLEEIGQGLAGVRLLDVLENILTWDGATQHEIVFVYGADFSDEDAYQIAEQRIRDEADGATRVIWRAASASSPPLYPDGVAGLLNGA